MRLISGFGIWAAVSVGFCALACQAGGVGDPCIPEDEYQQKFAGYDVGEVNIESRSFQCETRVCLVNHFQGRVSCPYGQDQAAIESGKDASDPLRCKIPNTEGTRTIDQVEVPVPNQKGVGANARSVENSVYCSCRCSNAKGSTEDGATYCKCPSGFKCVQLIEDLGLGSKQLAGGYCIRNGTDFNETVAYQDCQRKPDNPKEGNCGPAHPY